MFNERMKGIVRGISGKSCCPDVISLNDGHRFKGVAYQSRTRARDYLPSSAIPVLDERLSGCKASCSRCCSREADSPDIVRIDSSHAKKGIVSTRLRTGTLNDLPAFSIPVLNQC